MIIKLIGIDKSKKYLTTPDKCLSTHGAAGYSLGDYVNEEGYAVCMFCGAITTLVETSVHRFMPRQKLLEESG